MRQRSLYIEVNNRNDSVDNNGDDNQSDHRISTRNFSGEADRIGTIQKRGVRGSQPAYKTHSNIREFLIHPLKVEYSFAYVLSVPNSLSHTSPQPTKPLLKRIPRNR